MEWSRGVLEDYRMGVQGGIPVDWFYTKCDEFTGKRLQFLDRHHVACKLNNGALSGFEITGKGELCGGGLKRFRYTCDDGSNNTGVTPQWKQDTCVTRATRASDMNGRHMAGD